MPEENKPEDGNNDNVTEDKKPDAPVVKPEDELPEWARKKLTDANAEAANYRVKLRDAEDKLKNSKTLEEFQAATTELSAANAKLERSLLVSTVAAEHKLPKELAEVLTGNTKEELAAHAAILAKFAPKTETIKKVDPKDLDGGLNPNDPDDGETDPRKLAQKYGARRRR